eukprot:jgi/Mesvir1/5107/Mv15267-RA.1
MFATAANGANGEALLKIRDVWEDNLEEEMALIRKVVVDFPYLAMDTEFPGVVVRPVGTFRSVSDYHYQTLRLNVDMLKLIQLGLTFSDANGRLPSFKPGEVCVWQFNFREFNILEDLYAEDSIDLLKQSGIDFKLNRERGIDTAHFGDLLMSSGVVLNENVHWITFHSGYDFGYLLKLLTCKSLPEEEDAFFELLRLFFPCIYDIKYLMKFCDNLHGGLNRLAETLEVERIGPCHQAGSDSLLTSATFLKMSKIFFKDSTEKYTGVLYGLGSDGTEPIHA